MNEQQAKTKEQANNDLEMVKGYLLNLRVINPLLAKNVAAMAFNVEAHKAGQASLHDALEGIVGMTSLSIAILAHDNNELKQQVNNLASLIGDKI